VSHQYCSLFDCLLYSSSKQKQKKEIKNLKVSIGEQIGSVETNIVSLNEVEIEWKKERLKSLQKCEDVKEIALQSFSRFINISAPAQVWLSHEVNTMKSISAVSDLQGLVGEWSSLRTIASEIQSIGDSATQDANGKPVYNPGLIYSLKEKRDKKIAELIKEGAALRIDIAALEKERRHMHTLLLDLVYYIEQDSKHNNQQVNTVVNANMKTAIPDALKSDNDPATNMLPAPPKSALKKPTSSIDGSGDNGRVDVKKKKNEKVVRYDESNKDKSSVSFETSNVHVGLDSEIEDRSTMQDSDESGHLTDQWLEKLDLTNVTPLVNTMRRSIAHHTDTPQEVTFKTAIDAFNKKNEIENLRLNVVANETKVIWRNLQKSVNEFSTQICRKVRSDWASGSRVNDEYEKGNEVYENFHYGNCYFEQNDMLKPDSVPMNNWDNQLNKPSPEASRLTTMSNGIKFCQSWYSYRQRLIHAGMATESIYPCSPLYMLNRVLTIVKKPKQRKNKTTHQFQQQGLMQLLKERVEDIQQAKKAVEQRKEEFHAQSVTHEHLTEADRKARKKERSNRIKIFQKKLIAKRITRASSFALMSEQLLRKLNDKSRPSTGARSSNNTPVDGTKPCSSMIQEGSDEDDEDEEADSEEESDVESLFDDDSVDGRNQLMSDIADKGITTSSTSHHTVPLLGENSFIEGGLNVQFEPKDELNQAEAAKLYADLLEKVDKELSDQIVTQLTLKMGPESVSVVVYWQPFDDRLKIKVFCFNRNEEYTCYVDQVVVQDIFRDSDLSINSAKLSSMFVIRSLIERMTIESIPRSQALELSMTLKSSYPSTNVPETPDPREARLARKNKKSKAKDVDVDVKEGEDDQESMANKKESGFTELMRSNFNENVLAKNLNNNGDEEEKVHVLTIRALDTKGNMVYLYFIIIWIYFYICFRY